MTGDTNTVLVAADDPAAVAELRSLLVPAYRVEATTDGDDVLARLDDADAILVEYELRTASGTRVAAELDRRESARTAAIRRNPDPTAGPRRVAGETLVDPVAKADLLATVDRLCRRARYDELMAECAALAAKRGTLEARANADRSPECEEEYAALQRRLEALFSELDELVESFDGDDFRAAFEACTVGDSRRSRRAGEYS